MVPVKPEKYQHNLLLFISFLHTRVSKTAGAVRTAGRALLIANGRAYQRVSVDT